MNKSICTVLLISYNQEKFIARAIDSVLAQKTEYDFKIHIFDDGSKDNTAKIIKEYVRKYPRKIKAFISKKNKGAQTNIWNAYNSVKTKYCAMLECDDYWCDENKLQLQIKVLEDNPECSFCAHQTKIVNLNDNYRTKADNTFLLKNENILNKIVISYEDVKNEEKGYINHSSSRLIRMSCVDLKSIKYKEAFLYDNCQFYYLLLKGPMYFINKPMSCYVQTGEGRFSGLSPYKRINMQMQALSEFNLETDFVIADKIMQDMYRFMLYYFDILSKETNTKNDKE